MNKRIQQINWLKFEGMKLIFQKKKLNRVEMKFINSNKYLNNNNNKKEIYRNINKNLIKKKYFNLKRVKMKKKIK